MKTQVLQAIVLQLNKYKSEIKKTILVFFSVFFLFWLLFVHYNDAHHVSVSRNLISGKIKLDDSKGIFITPLWVQVIKFDTRPTKICVECSCSNVDCKLISFNPDGWKDFIDREGFKYFWFKNRISFNLGQQNEYRGVRHVLRGYAFDGKEYSFITHLGNVE